MADPREILLKGSRFHVERRELTKRDGGVEPRELVVHPGAVVVLPVLDDGRLVLIRNYRFSVEQVLWEVCAGTRDPGEPPELCAARELEEETGYRAGKLTPLLDMYTAPGISNERMFGFVATDLEKTAQHLDQTEHIEVHCLSPDEVMRMIHARQIEDAKSLAVLLYWNTFVRGK
mgnify:CR=1 FL=1